MLSGADGSLGRHSGFHPLGYWAVLEVSFGNWPKVTGLKTFALREDGVSQTSSLPCSGAATVMCHDGHF